MPADIGMDVTVRDITGSLACYGLWGPCARDILATCTSDDLSFPYMQARFITVGDAPCWALRVTYVGELGWELYPSAEFGVRLWDTLVAAGRPFGLVPGGYRAIDSMRLEKGYRAWASDITSETDPYSAGLGFAVRADKDFLGREALPTPHGGGQRLCCLVLADPRSVALGNEPVFVPGDHDSAGTVIGRVSSGGLGYTLGVSIAYAWLPATFAAPGTELCVEVFGEAIRCEVRTDPLYDPAGARIRS
jgi:4-methylaminobutanoate oxidase (formaldehyde-forming)